MYAPRRKDFKNYLDVTGMNKWLGGIRITGQMNPQKPDYHCGMQCIQTAR